MSYKGVKDKIPSAVPTDYDRVTDFSDYEANNPGENFLGADLDAEFDAIEQAIDETQDRLSIIQRDDGALANQSVGADQLKPNVTFGFGVVEDWQTATPYDLNDGVWESRKLYRCIESHTSGTFATDLAAGKWEEIADFDQWLTAAESEATDAANSAAAIANLTTQTIQTTKGCLVFQDTPVTGIAQATTQIIPFGDETDPETFDTDSFHSTVTNNSRITIPAAYNGYYAEIYAEIGVNGGNNGDTFQVEVLQDGMRTVFVGDGVISSGNGRLVVNFKQVLSAGEYYEVLVRNNTSGTIDVADSWFGIFIVSAPVGTGPSVPPTYSGYINAQSTYIVDDASVISPYMEATTNLTESQFGTVGPTGSGADYEWSALDNVPDQARFIVVNAAISLTPSANGNVNCAMYNRQPGSSVTLSFGNQLVALNVYQETGGQISNVSRDAIIPIDSNNQFDLYWISSGAALTNETFRLYLRGFGAH